MTHQNNQGSETVASAVFALFDGLFKLLRYSAIYLWRHPELLSVLVVAWVVSWTPAPTWACWLLGLVVGVLISWRFRLRLIQRRARLSVKAQVKEALSVQGPWATEAPTVTVTKPQPFQDTLETTTTDWRKN